MSNTISLIQRVQIASPCTADWNAMAGDDRVRFCDQCKLNVYNLSEMSERDAEKLIIEKEGKLCIRVYRRHDGTVLTRDCPVGLAKVRKHVINVLVRVAALIVVLVCSAVYAALSSRNRDPQLECLVPTTYSKAKVSVRRWLTATPPPLLPLQQRGCEMGERMVIHRE